MANVLSLFVLVFDVPSCGFSLLPTCKNPSLMLTFFVTLVQKPILDVDFLCHFGLLIDMRKHQLTDAVTHLRVQGILTTDYSPSPPMLPKDPNNPYLSLLSEFLALTQVCSPNCPVKHDITHHIETTSAPVSARPRHLAPECLQVAKQGFEHMLQLGIIRLSSSTWSSPLHMVPKKTPGDWHPCGDLSCIEPHHCCKLFGFSTETLTTCHTVKVANRRSLCSLLHVPYLQKFSREFYFHLISRLVYDNVN